MKMTPVVSSNIAAIGYDLICAELVVQFKNGKTFYYLEVSPEEHTALMAAESVGKHFNQFIKAVKVGSEVTAAKNDTPTMIDNIRSTLSAIYNAGFEAGECGACDDIDIVDGHEEKIISLVLSAEKDKEKIELLREALQDVLWKSSTSRNDAIHIIATEALEATKGGE